MEFLQDEAAFNKRNPAVQRAGPQISIISPLTEIIKHSNLQLTEF